MAAPTAEPARYGRCNNGGMTRVRRAAAGAIVTAVAAGIAASSVGAQSPHARLYFLGSSGKTLLPVVRLVHALTPQNVLAALLEQRFQPARGRLRLMR